ncbi:SpaH/EbpB family LPXTG-anchored major pilin [Enterococcus saccharolyticus]|uniref:SpaH/EbpB family LPXTG-anchored major pilin n=1 Tax=Enterococcus saccharolyticus TaxID=41997 RepID=UPI001E625ADD|nr:SpaH/EbpB family LPXTG-anchored major pilin [Enterococcus saccharolyticus]MCD5003096.1 SpaH/EbpB family LPXTG-anchored major pilin [Enterococcus saccharolyticus]
MQKKRIIEKVFATLVLIFVFCQLTGRKEVHAESADVTLHKVFYQDISELTEKQNTGEIDPSFSGNPLPGAEFTAYDVTDRYHELIAKASGTIEEKQKKVMALIQQEFTPLAPSNASQVGQSIVTDSNGLASFSNLLLNEGEKDKVYVFVETKTPAHVSITQKSAPLVVAMPIYTASGSLNQDIHLYPKNVSMTDKKFFDNKNQQWDATINGEQFVNITTGDLLDFELQLNIPSDIDQHDYRFVDNPSKGLIYEPETLAIEGLTSHDYTITPQGNGFIVVLNTQSEAVKQLAGKTMRVTYKMRLTSEVIPDQLEENKAHVEIDGQAHPEMVTKEKPTDPENPDTPEVKFGTGGKKFKKIDAHTSEALTGAEFVVKNQAGQFARFAESTNSKGEYVFVNWVEEADATKLVSDEDGLIKIIGMTNGEYLLKETKAPSDKYVTLKEEIAFTIQFGEYNTQALEIKNTPKGLLPSTGGKGIYGFLAVGAMMMLGAYIWFKKSKVQAHI